MQHSAPSGRFKLCQHFIAKTSFFIFGLVLTIHDLRADLPLQLESAAPFGVLAGAGITITGPTIIHGDIGTFPTPAITGLENLTLNGTNHADNEVTEAAKIDLSLAYFDAEGRTPTFTYDPIFDLGGLILLPGVYNNPSSFGITGQLTLDAAGDPNAVWIFQTGSTLITASDSTVVLIDGASFANVFWQVGSSATLGVDSVFAGNILALQDITLNTGAAIDGGLYALNGAVTLDNNTITSVPEPGSILLLGSALILRTGRRRRTAPTR